jgi:3-methyladenine DNA glycosylase AlkD
MNNKKQDFNEFCKNLDINLQKLKKKGTKYRAEYNKRYLKSPYAFYGVVSKDLREHVTAYHKENHYISKDYLKQLLLRLWNSSWHTEKTFAVNLAAKYINLFTNKDILFFKKWLDECNNWDHTDAICADIIGKLLLKYPNTKKEINFWTKEQVLWTKRASLISYIRYVRIDKTDLKPIFNNIKKLEQEKDFFIRKAIGWILREASKKQPKIVKEFVISKKDKLSNLSIRQALRLIETKEFINNLINSKR